MKKEEEIARLKAQAESEAATQTVLDQNVDPSKVDEQKAIFADLNRELPDLDAAAA